MKRKSRKLIKFFYIIGSSISALSVVAAFFPDEFAIISGLPNSHQIAMMFVVVTMLGMFFFIWKQTVDDAEYKLQVEHKAMHKYAHLLRDTTYEVQKLNPNGENDVLAMHMLKTFATDTVECLADSLIALTDADPSKNELMVCVKILDLEYWDNLSIKDKSKVTYRTLSRSITPKGALQKDDSESHGIEECTAFYKVFVEGKHDWTGLKLNSPTNTQIISEDELHEGNEYCETCTTWPENFQHKIVVPIRVKLSEINPNFLNSDERNLFGFLCVEYKRESLFKFSGKDDLDLISICDYLKIYADTMYTVFDNIYKGTSYSN